MNTLEKDMNFFIPTTSNRLKSNITILLQRWLWHKITLKGWHGINQRNQTKPKMTVNQLIHIKWVSERWITQIFHWQSSHNVLLGKIEIDVDFYEWSLHSLLVKILSETDSCKIVFCRWKLSLSNSAILLPLSVLVSMEINESHFFKTSLIFIKN